MGPNQTDNTILLKNLSFTEEDKEFSFEVAVNTNRLYNNGKYWMRASIYYNGPSPSFSCIDIANGEVKTYSNGRFVESLALESTGVRAKNFPKDKYEDIIEIKGKFPVLKSGIQYSTYIQITLYTDLKNKNN